MLVHSGCGRPSADTPTASGNIEWYLFITNELPEQTRQDVAMQFEQLYCTTATAGDYIHLVSVPDHEAIVSISVPSGGAKTRLRHKAIQQVKSSLKLLTEPLSTSGDRQVELTSVPATVNALRKSDFPCRVILVGDPIYRSTRHAGWSMHDGVIPTDGAFTAERSPFRTESNFPQGTQLTWLAPDSEWGTDAAHREAVTRFARLFVQEHQGTMVRMATDPASAFRFEPPQFTDVITKREERPGVRVVSGLSKRDDTQIDTENIDFETPTPSPTPEPVSPAIVPDQPVNPAPLPAPTPQPQKPETAEEVLNRVQRDTDRIAIAINWESSKPCDLDLWISSRGVNEELSYRLKKTSFGKLHRDVMRTGSVKADSGEYQNWEWAEISHSDLGALKLWINAHSAASPVTIKVVIVANGSRREKLVRMNVTKGDGAASSGTRHQSSAWLKVDLTN